MSMDSLTTSWLKGSEHVIWLQSYDVMLQEELIGSRRFGSSCKEQSLQPFTGEKSIKLKMNYGYDLTSDIVQTVHFVCPDL